MRFERIGGYRVTAKIGEGGMGEVYRARDTKLDRDVALKVLPQAFTDDPDRLARFEREAKVLASLNHPNIGHIYGLEEAEGQKALVLELVEGPTLAERIKQGPIPVDEALPIAKQIAEALEAAHEQGIIHRDLKPANIKVKLDGIVKVLDFGLAKAFQPDASDPSMSQSPTISLTAAATQMGMVIGTAAYMAPEQAKGKVVDKRADVWAFGAVLFEMLTGMKAFSGDDVTDTIAAVVRAEPEWSLLPAETPGHVRMLLRGCLRKETRERIRDIGDARLSLDGVFAQPTDDGSRGIVNAPVWRRVLPYALTTLVAGLLGAGFVSWSSPEPSEREARTVARFSVALLPVDFFGAINDRVVATAPDGSAFAYAANQQLYQYSLRTGTTEVVGGTEAVAPLAPVFSPDGRWLAFFSDRDGQLQRVPTSGGAAVSIADIEPPPYGVSWTDDDEIVFAQDRKGIFRVTSSGGVPELLIPAESEGNLRVHGPQMLPDGQSVLFTVARSSWDNGRIVVQSIDSSERRVLVDGGTDGRYLATGHLVYIRNNTLFAVPLDLERLEVTAGPVPVLEGVGRAMFSGGGHFSVSRNGMLVYLPGGGIRERRLIWRDRAGRAEPIAAQPSGYVQARISPDGSKAVLEVSGRQSDLWLWDFARESMTRLVVDPSNDEQPEWSPDGQHIIFRSDRNETFGLYRIAADGTGDVETLIESARGLNPLSFTRDGNRLIVNEVLADGGAPELSIVTLEGEPRVEPLFHPGYLIDDADISPDGRWLVYESGAGGGVDIFVRPFPDLDAGRFPISTDGGFSSMWGPDGSEIFFGERGSGNGLMRVEVTTEPTFTASRPERLFLHDQPLDRRDRDYDIHPDGERFLMISATDGSTGGDPLSGLLRIEVVLNWHQELLERVPIP